MTGKLWSEERVPQRWGSTVLSQLLFPPWDSLLHSPESLPGGLRRADCTHANNVAESAQWNGMKNLFYIRGFTRKTIKGPSVPLTLSLFPLLFFVLLLQIQTIHIARPTQDLRTDDFLASLSLFHLYFSSLLLCLVKVQLSYSTPYFALKFVAGVGSLLKCVIKVKGLIENTFETKEWVSCQS